MVQVHSDYPDGYHVTIFLKNALVELGATVTFDDDRLHGCEGFVVNGVPVAWLLDNRVPANREWQDPAAAAMLQAGNVIVCHCQKEDAERVGGRWLPIAATPRFQRNPKRKPTYDGAFVGYLKDQNRLAVIQGLASEYNLNIKSKVFYEDAAAVYHSAKVGVNVPAFYKHPRNIDYDINMRTFEVMASGVPLVTAYNPALADLGIHSGVNCLTYDNPDELHHILKWVIDDDQLLEDIAINGWELVQRRHTYKHRAEQVLEWVAEWQTSQLQPE